MLKSTAEVIGFCDKIRTQAHAITRPAFAALPDDEKLETIRIYLPSLPPRLLTAHVKLVVAFRDLAKRGR